MFGSLMMLVFGFWVILFSLVSVFGIFCFLERYLGKFVKICVVSEILFSLMLIFVVVVNFWMIGRSE